MAGNVTNKAAAPANQPSTGKRTLELDRFGKFVGFCWLVAVCWAGGNLAFPATILQGLAEIWNGQSRTAVGWTVVIGIVLGVLWLIAWGVAEYLDQKSARAARVVNPSVRPPAHNPLHKPAEAVEPPKKDERAEPAQAAKRAKPLPPGEQAALAQLQKIITDYGRDVLGNSTQCERLVRERCEAAAAKIGVSTRREANVLLAALHEGLPDRLAKGGGALSRTAVLNHAAALSQAAGLDQGSARFAVEAWATALGVRCEG
jgi:hypothetical protein